MIRHLLTVNVILFVALPLMAQDQSNERLWETQSAESDASLRGLCVVNAQTVWASGTAGTVLRTVDAGQHWEVIQVAGAEELDFRDVHAFDEQTAVIISAGQPARVYRTEDGGKSWNKVFEHRDSTAFFDAMEFSGDRGVAFSDPIEGHLELITSNNQGKTWTQMRKRPKTLDGEAGFAASGSCLQLQDGKVFVGLGGEHEQKFARVVSRDLAGHAEWAYQTTPMVANATSGIFSLAFADTWYGVAVGGDYQAPNQTDGNVAITADGGASWQKITGQPPTGFRSAVAAVSLDNEKEVFVCVGTNGIDVSTDNGNHWQKMGNVGFHAIAFDPDGKTGWMVGSEGRVAKLDLEAIKQWLKRAAQ